MNVSYTMPLQQSWARMVRMLFRPFRLESWLTVGFAAFLSEYLSHFGGEFADFRREGDGVKSRTHRRMISQPSVCRYFALTLTATIK